MYGQNSKYQVVIKTVPVSCTVCFYEALQSSMFDSYNMLLKILNTNFSGISVESKDEGIVVSSVEEGRLAHVQGKQITTK